MHVVTAREVYGLTLDLIDKRDSAGFLQEGNLKRLEKKAPALISVLQQELSLNEKGIPVSIICELDVCLDISDEIAVGVLPLGLAAQMALQGGDENLAAYFLNEYNMAKQRIRLPEGKIEDAQGLLAGLI